MVDWVDSDDEVTGNFGAESGYYESLDPSYLSPDQPTITLADLVKVKGFTPSIVEALLPYVTALPVENTKETTRININSVSAGVLNAISTDLSVNEQTLEFLIAARSEKPFEIVVKFASAFQSITGSELKPGITALLEDVKGDYF